MASGRCCGTTWVPCTKLAAKTRAAGLARAPNGLSGTEFSPNRIIGAAARVVAENGHRSGHARPYTSDAAHNTFEHVFCARLQQPSSIVATKARTRPSSALSGLYARVRVVHLGCEHNKKRFCAEFQRGTRLHPECIPRGGAPYCTNVTHQSSLRRLKHPTYALGFVGAEWCAKASQVQEACIVR
jgi:hypothetical protein